MSESIVYEKWKWWGKMPHFSQNRKFLQILFLSKSIISNR